MRWFPRVLLSTTVSTITSVKNNMAPIAGPTKYLNVGILESFSPSNFVTCPYFGCYSKVVVPQTCRSFPLGCHFQDEQRGQMLKSAPRNLGALFSARNPATYIFGLSAKWLRPQLDSGNAVWLKASCGIPTDCVPQVKEPEFSKSSN